MRPGWDVLSTCQRLTRTNLRRARPALFCGWLAAWAVADGTGCGRADSQPPAGVAPQSEPEVKPVTASPDPTDSVTPAGEDGGGSTPSTDAGPARETIRDSSGLPWARDPGTGLCRAYEDVGHPSVNWRVFSTEAECERSCTCQELECVCNGIACPSTIDEATRSLCAEAQVDYPPTTVLRREGCGLIALSTANGFAGKTWIFAPNATGDAGDASAPLVGSSSFVDVDTQPCASFSWFAGESFDCEEATACQVCGSEIGLALPGCD